MKPYQAACCSAVGLALFTLAPCSVEAQVHGVCVYNCAPPPSYSPQQPSGPSPQELKRQREEKDLREASDDANDKGMDAYKRGDLEAAARYFREALEYAPGDEELLHNLSIVEGKIRDARQIRFGQAAEQLKSTEQHSRAASGLGETGSKAEALRGFDDRGANAGTLAVPASGSSIADASRDPIVPASRRTPEITRLEQQRQEARNQAAELEKELAELNPATQSVEIAKAKQQKSTIESKVQYLNFSITQKLEAPDSPGR